MPRNWASFTALSLPIVAVRIGGTIVRALVDTGASQSLIDPHLVKQLGFANQGSGWIVGIATAPIEIPLVSIAGLSIGQCALRPFKSGSLISLIFASAFNLFSASTLSAVIAFNSISRKEGCIYFPE